MIERPPRSRVAPPATSRGFGDDAFFLASAYGLTLDDWQSDAVSDCLAVRGNGRWAASRYGMSAPRQNGKNVVLEVVELFKMVGLGRRILHTAHEVKTARKSFLRLCSFFENERKHPELAAMVDSIRRTNGQEAIYLVNGGSCEFIARSKGSGRGFTVDDLVFDEAQELDDFAYSALLPTISAAPSGNPQQIITGTPPGPRDNGEVFTRLRSDALGGKSIRTVWIEYSMSPDGDPDDMEQIAQANPGLDIRLDRETVADERAAMDDEMFRRERGGLWELGGLASVIPRRSWMDRADAGSVAVSDLALGVEVAPDLGWASVSLAGRRADGTWHVELWERRETAAWVVPYVAALLASNPAVRGVAADAGSPSLALFDDFKAAGVRLMVPRVVELGQSCGTVLAGVIAGSVWHTDQPQMTTAAMTAGKRMLGDTGMWVWSRRTATSDITPIQAATLALWAAEHDKPKKPITGRNGSGRRVMVYG